MTRPARAARLELTGRRIDRGPPVRCRTCGGYLLEDAAVTGYAYRFPEEPSLSVPRLYCAACDRQHIEFPTLGAHEVQFDARLQQDGDVHVIGDVRILEYSSPTETAPRVPT